MSAFHSAARVFNAPHFVWFVLVLPAVVWTYDYARGAGFYGQYLHDTGELSAQLLIATLAVTPLRLMFPAAGWTRWLLQRRRYLGVATFGYSLLHAGAYIQRAPALAAIAQDALQIAMWTGWLAFLIMLALAATSNDTAVRRLKRAWKALHRWVYAAALLTFAHWILSAFDPVPGAIHLGVLVALETYRVWAGARRSSG